VFLCSKQDHVDANNISRKFVQAVQAANAERARMCCLKVDNDYLLLQLPTSQRRFENGPDEHISSILGDSKHLGYMCLTDRFKALLRSPEFGNTKLTVQGLYVPWYEDRTRPIEFRELYPPAHFPDLYTNQSKVFPCGVVSSEHGPVGMDACVHVHVHVCVCVCVCMCMCVCVCVCVCVSVCMCWCFDRLVE
jgi:hypothetical protein